VHDFETFLAMSSSQADAPEGMLAPLSDQVDAARQIVVTAQRMLWGGETADCGLRELALLEQLDRHIGVLVNEEDRPDGSDATE
jgi:hypothetical protein